MITGQSTTNQKEVAPSEVFQWATRSIQINWFVINRISLTCTSIDSSLNALSKVFSLQFDWSKISVAKWPLKPSSLANSRHFRELSAKQLGRSSPTQKPKYGVLQESANFLITKRIPKCRLLQGLRDDASSKHFDNVICVARSNSAIFAAKDRFISSSLKQLHNSARRLLFSVL